MNLYSPILHFFQDVLKFCFITKESWAISSHKCSENLLVQTLLCALPAHFNDIQGFQMRFFHVVQKELFLLLVSPHIFLEFYFKSRRSSSSRPQDSCVQMTTEIEMKQKALKDTLGVFAIFQRKFSRPLKSPIAIKCTFDARMSLMGHCL